MSDNGIGVEAYVRYLFNDPLEDTEIRSRRV